MCTNVYVWRSEDIFPELVLSFQMSSVDVAPFTKSVWPASFHVSISLACYICSQTEFPASRRPKDCRPELPHSVPSVTTFSNLICLSQAHSSLSMLKIILSLSWHHPLCHPIYMQPSSLIYVCHCHREKSVQETLLVWYCLRAGNSQNNNQKPYRGDIIAGGEPGCSPC